MTIIKKINQVKNHPDFPNILLEALQKIEKQNEQLTLAKKYSEQQIAEIECLKFIIRQHKIRSYEESGNQYYPKSGIWVEPYNPLENQLSKEMV